MNETINKRIYVSILGAISRKIKELQAQSNKLISLLDKNPQNVVLNEISDPKLKLIFFTQVAQYFSWQGAFRNLIKEQKYSSNQIYKAINVDQGLIPIISQVQNVEEPHNQFAMKIMTYSKRSGIQRQFVKKWKDLTKQKFLNRTKSRQFVQIKQAALKHKAQTSNLQSQKSQKQKNASDKQQKIFKEDVLDSNPEKRTSSVMKQLQKQHQIRKQAKAMADQVRKQKMQRILKYLEFICSGTQSTNVTGPNYISNTNNGNFYIAPQNVQHVAKELLMHLQKFMSDKIKQVLHIAKMKHQGYKSQIVGDQFRYFGQTGQQILKQQTKQAVTKLPQYESSIKFIQLTMPSKLQLYFRLRQEESRHEQYLKNEYKNRLGEVDKKSDKFLQNYTFQDEKKQKQESRVDLGPSKTVRLKITAACVQWAIENDPFFKDQWIMQKTLIND